MSTSPDSDLDALARVAGLPIAPEHAPGVRQNFALISSMAELVNAFPLDESDEAAPVFQAR